MLNIGSVEEIKEKGKFWEIIKINGGKFAKNLGKIVCEDGDMIINGK